MALLTINLIPPRVRAERAKRMFIVVAVAVGLGLLAIPLAVLYFKWMSVSLLKGKYRALEAESKNYAGIIEKVVELENKETALVKKLDAIDGLVSRQWIWIKLLETISQCQSQVGDIWFTSLKSKTLAGADAGKTELTLEGNAFSIAAVVDFQNMVLKSGLGVEFTKTNMQSAQVGTGNQTAVKFMTVLKFKA